MLWRNAIYCTLCGFVSANDNWLHLSGELWKITVTYDWICNCICIWLAQKFPSTIYYLLDCYKTLWYSSCRFYWQVGWWDNCWWRWRIISICLNQKICEWLYRVSIRFKFDYRYDNFPLLGYILRIVHLWINWKQPITRTLLLYFEYVTDGVLYHWNNAQIVCPRSCLFEWFHQRLRFNCCHYFICDAYYENKNEDCRFTQSASSDQSSRRDEKSYRWKKISVRRNQSLEEIKF